MGPTLDLGLALGQRRGGTPALVAEPEDDAHWVAAARTGDRAAFGHLYSRWALHSVRTIVSQQLDRAELVQDGDQQ